MLNNPSLFNPQSELYDDTFDQLCFQRLIFKTFPLPKTEPSLAQVLKMMCPKQPQRRGKKDAQPSTYRDLVIDLQSCDVLVPLFPRIAEPCGDDLKQYLKHYITSFYYVKWKWSENAWNKFCDLFAAKWSAHLRSLITTSLPSIFNFNKMGSSHVEPQTGRTLIFFNCHRRNRSSEPLAWMTIDFSNQLETSRLDRDGLVREATVLLV